MNASMEMQSLESAVFALGLVMTRVSAFVVSAPIFGQGTVPNTVKLGLCLALSIFWWPSYIQQMSIAGEPSTVRFVAALLMEFAVGFSLGYLIRLVILPARIAGSYVGQELGFNLGQVADPTTGGATNETGILFDAFGLLIFWVTDAHHITFRMLGMSMSVLRADREFFYSLAPVTGQLLSRAHELGIMIVAPLAAILFITLISLSVVMRAWPHVTLFSFGMGARLLIGLAAFLFLMPAIITNMAYVFRSVAQSISDAIQLLY